MAVYFRKSIWPKVFIHLGEFRDNCGFGLIAHCEGEASHDLLMTSIQALTRMTHRGGIVPMVRQVTVWIVVSDARCIYASGSRSYWG